MEDFDLMKKWATKIPKYDEKFSGLLFDNLTKKGGGSDKESRLLGKHFNTNYELYIYAFFLGLYSNQYEIIPEDAKRKDFSHAIQFWGSKTGRKERNEFTILQQYIFTSCIAKTEIDLLDLEKGILPVDDVVKKLIETLESYTNGGLKLIQEAMEKPNFGLSDRSFLDLMFGESETGAVR